MSYSSIKVNRLQKQPVELIDVFDEIEADDVNLFEEASYCTEFTEMVFHLLDLYLQENLEIFDEDEEDFEDELFEEVKDIVMLQMEHHTYFDSETEADIEEMYEDAFELYLDTFIGSYSYDLSLLKQMFASIATGDHEKQQSQQLLQKRIEELKAKPQPQQRTSQWYEFRHNLITASNAWKAFESQAQINSLIYEKCQPMKTFETDARAGPVNVNSSLHWGQKYEPLSVILYEQKFNTTVDDFGCIQHEKHYFLGASPDGINVDPKSDKFGRMLEIKNVVSREITGVPKKEYWVQTQLQMEVCDLDECDFLETKFVEYENIDAFLNDTEDKTRGIIMYFQTKEERPFYIYKVVNNYEEENIEQWENEMITLHEMDKKMWVQNYFWKLEVFSCVLLKRDREWFQSNISQLENVWNIILEERETGYEHRAPKRRVKKEEEEIKVEATVPFTGEIKRPSMLLKIIKLSK